MGSIILPPSGRVYVDAQCLIYTVEQQPPWFAVLDPLWRAVQAGSLRVATSELSLVECLVMPYRRGDQQLAADFESLLNGPEVDLIPITPGILREAARLRATTARFRPPDAIHAATALSTPVALFVTNDSGFRNVPNLPVEYLQDVITRS